MTTPEDLGALVVAGDFELGMLSDEEYEALWVDQALQETGKVPPGVAVAIKSLLSSERAELVDGELVLGGFLGLIRFTCDAAIVEVIVEVEDGDSFTWSVCGPVLLQRDWTPPGLLRFVLRPRPQAVTGLVSDLFSAAPDRRVAVNFTVGEGEDPVVRTFVRQDGAASWSDGLETVPVDQLALRRRLQEFLAGL